jgi:hypothetical protein
MPSLAPEPAGLAPLGPKKRRAGVKAWPRKSLSPVRWLITPAPDNGWSCTPCRTGLSGLPEQACSGQAPLRHPGDTAYRCFLPDLAGFTGSCRAGPNLHRHFAWQSRLTLGPRGGIRPRYGGLRVQGTASSPSSTTKEMLPQKRRLVKRPNRAYELYLRPVEASDGARHLLDLLIGQLGVHRQR